jgi:hypothetical protein
VRRAAALALVAIALAGCGGSHGAIPATDLGKLVLRQQDVGAPFAPFSSGPQTQLDNQGTPRSDPARDGREGGWIARFHRSGSVSTTGPLVVESRVDVFKSDGGAKKDVGLYGTMFAAAPGAQSVAPPKLGDQSVATTFVQAGTKPLRFYRIAWRYENATASVTAEGFDGRLRLADALALARKQQRLLTQA